MAKVLNAAQVKALKYAGKGRSSVYGIDSTCSLYLVCFDNGTRFYKFRDKKLGSRQVKRIFSYQF